jgi:hypothetical protein
MRGLRSDQAHRLFSISGVTLAFCALVLCAAQAMFGCPFRKTIVLNPAKFLPVEGFAYSAPLLRKFSPRGAQSASARLYEDVRVSSLYSQRAKSVIRFGQGIFSFPEKGRLLFSASDNSDPRINGRIYKIEVPHRLSGSVLVICFTALLASVGMHVLMLPNRREALLVWRSRVGRILGPIVSLVGKRPAIVLSIPSIYLFCSFPPLWKDVDALVQLTVPACDVNILHYPPLYSFSGRIPFVVASTVPQPLRTAAAVSCGRLLPGRSPASGLDRRHGIHRSISYTEPHFALRFCGFAGIVQLPVHACPLLRIRGVEYSSHICAPGGRGIDTPWFCSLSVGRLHGRLVHRDRQSASQPAFRYLAACGPCSGRPGNKIWMVFFGNKRLQLERDWRCSPGRCCNSRAKQLHG